MTFSHRKMQLITDNFTQRFAERVAVVCFTMLEGPSVGETMFRQS
jgi:hypothetical protein